MTQLDILSVVFGFLAAISGLLRGASFTRVDREKYPKLKKLDGKKVPLFISTFVFLILAAVTQIIQVTTKPLLEQTQGPGGQIFEKATLTRFEKEVEEALSEQRSQTTDYFKAAEHDFSAGLYRAAISNYQKSISVIPTMSSYLNLGISLFYLSEYDKADEAFTSGRQIAVKKRDKKLEASFCLGLGLVYHGQGKYEDALTFFQDALAAFKEMEGRASALGSIGNVYHRQGKLEEALRFHRDALATFKEIDNPLGRASALANIGLVYFQQGKLEEALRFHRDALAAFKEIDNPLGQANAIMYIGLVYHGQGKYEDALTFFQDALATFKKIGGPLGQADALMNIGNVYFKQGKLEKALKSHRDALAIFKEISNPSGQAYALMNIGNVYFKQDKKNEAMKIFNEAHTIFLEIGATEQLRLAEQTIAQLETAMK